MIDKRYVYGGVILGAIMIIFSVITLTPTDYRNILKDGNVSNINLFVIENTDSSIQLLGRSFHKGIEYYLWKYNNQGITDFYFGTNRQAHAYWSLYKGKNKLIPSSYNLVNFSYDNITASIIMQTNYNDGILKEYVQIYPLRNKISIEWIPKTNDRYCIQWNILTSNKSISRMLENEYFLKSFSADWSDSQDFVNYSKITSGLISVRYKCSIGNQFIDPSLGDTLSYGKVMTYLDGENFSKNYEYGEYVNITGFVNDTNNSVCINFNVPGYGINYTCGNKSVSFLWNVVPQLNTFTNGKTYLNLTFNTSSLRNFTTITYPNNVLINYLNVTLFGANNSIDYPSDIVIDVFNDSVDDFQIVGKFVGSSIHLSKVSTGTTYKDIQLFQAEGKSGKIFYFRIPIWANITSGSFNISGLDYYYGKDVTLFSNGMSYYVINWTNNYDSVQKTQDSTAHINIVKTSHVQNFSFNIYSSVLSNSYPEDIRLKIGDDSKDNWDYVAPGVMLNNYFLIRKSFNNNYTKSGEYDYLKMPSNSIINSSLLNLSLNNYYRDIGNSSEYSYDPTWSTQMVDDGNWSSYGSVWSYGSSIVYSYMNETYDSVQDLSLTKPYLVANFNLSAKVTDVGVGTGTASINFYCKNNGILYNIYSNSVTRGTGEGLGETNFIANNISISLPIYCFQEDNSISIGTILYSLASGDSVNTWAEAYHYENGIFYEKSVYSLVNISNNKYGLITSNENYSTQGIFTNYTDLNPFIKLEKYFMNDSKTIIIGIPFNNFSQVTQNITFNIIPSLVSSNNTLHNTTTHNTTNYVFGGFSDFKNAFDNDFSTYSNCECSGAGPSDCYCNYYASYFDLKGCSGFVNITTKYNVTVKYVGGGMNSSIGIYFYNYTLNNFQQILLDGCYGIDCSKLTSMNYSIPINHDTVGNNMNLSILYVSNSNDYAASGKDSKVLLYESRLVSNCRNMSNIYVEVGTPDGITEWAKMGNIISPTIVSISPTVFNNYLSGSCPVKYLDYFCAIPIYIITNSSYGSGNFSIQNLSVNTTTNRTIDIYGIIKNLSVFNLDNTTNLRTIPLVYESPYSTSEGKFGFFINYTSSMYYDRINGTLQGYLDSSSCVANTIGECDVNLSFYSLSKGYLNVSNLFFHGSSYPENLSLKFADIGVVDYNYTGIFNESFVLNYTLSPNSINKIKSYINGYNCYGQRLICDVPIRVYTDETGIIRIRNISIIYPIQATSHIVDDELIYNYSKFNSSVIKIVVRTSNQSGLLWITNIMTTYIGTVTYLVNTTWNSAVPVSHTLNITVYYTPINVSLPIPYTWFEVFLNNPNQKNLTPFGQTNSKPIFNITNVANHTQKADISIKINQSFTNITFEASNTSNFTYIWNLNSSSQALVIGNISKLSSKGIWVRVQLYNVSINSSITRYLSPDFIIQPWCSSCYRNLNN